MFSGHIHILFRYINASQADVTVRWLFPLPPPPPPLLLLVLYVAVTMAAVLSLSINNSPSFQYQSNNKVHANFFRLTFCTILNYSHYNFCLQMLKFTWCFAINYELSIFFSPCVVLFVISGFRANSYSFSVFLLKSDSNSVWFTKICSKFKRRVYLYHRMKGEKDDGNKCARLQKIGSLSITPKMALNMYSKHETSLIKNDS